MLLSSEDIDYLIGTVDEGSVKIMQVYKAGFSVFSKEDTSPVTHADILANQILVDALLLRWPLIPILSEESTDATLTQDSPCYWAIDPLDGTKEFIQKNDQFTVNLALILHGEPVFGIVAAPALGTLYCGGIGLGASKRIDSVWRTLSQTSLEPDWSNPLAPIAVVVSRSHPSPELSSWLMGYSNHQLHELGSSLKLCHVAEGLVDCYPRFTPTCIWDIAAGQAILRAVSGEVWVWPIDERNPLRYLDPTKIINPSFMATGLYVRTGTNQIGVE